MRYARRMNGYSEVPHNGEINNYLRKDLDAKATAKNTACWNGAADVFLEIVMQPFLGFDDIVPDSSSPATV